MCEESGECVCEETMGFNDSGQLMTEQVRRLFTGCECSSFTGPSSETIVHSVNGNKVKKMNGLKECEFLIAQAPLQVHAAHKRVL